MVQTNNLFKGSIIGALATAASAQSLFTPIDYKSTLDVNYYFRNASDVKATVNDEGIDIEGSFGSNSELCSALRGAQIVYSKDNGDEILLTADCQSVYHLVDDSNQEITWDSCQEFSFYQSDCGNGAISSSAGYSSLVSSASSAASAQASSSQSITNSASSSSSASYAENSISNGETLYLTTVTSTINNIETIYTTYCPISEIIASRTHAQITGGTTNINAQPAQTSNANAASTGVYTSTFVSTSSGSVGTFTSLYPITGGASSSQINNQKPGRVYVTATDYYESIASQSSASSSSTSPAVESSSSERALTVITETHSGVQTVYTTYCPESSTSGASAASAPSPVAPSSTSIPVETSSSAPSSVAHQAATPKSESPIVASSAPASAQASQASSESVIKPQTQATNVSIISESAATQNTGNAAPTQSNDVSSTQNAVSTSTGAAVQSSASVSIAQQQGSAAANGTVSSPQVSVYEGGANKLINSISAVSIVAIVFGFFC
ncbi:Cortactin-binding protein [Wickerhamomyces ciferrii]|uniref:Cortactin-binding protein n=1 Tax=Wickerhamomyces ciferrii (strain ATCC 14091 / BCRC 22168 / CBS 111 / JCM 3599 / NBRC 0793 / NRRL Y-1031 F-60-10) TaxID=1206466 RepID=K0KJQ6_WICCF|nr:Cortactin-binding protein [Wickerhamomyces ciferrii]CCH42372.1 Cortactin-binding protein [Wickerhamomyces ciferrii]